MRTFSLFPRLAKSSISRGFVLASLACLTLGCSRTGSVVLESGRPVRVPPVEELVDGTVEKLDVATNGAGIGVKVGGSDHVYDLPTFDPEGRLEGELLDHTYITKPVGGVVIMNVAPAW